MIEISLRPDYETVGDAAYLTLPASRCLTRKASNGYAPRCAEYPAWQRSCRSSPNTVTPYTWRRAAACYLSIKERMVCDTP